jgi:hypothetical protein
MTKKALTILYTNIGRGHPFYLDGVVAEWARCGGDPAALDLTDVFHASGPVPRQMWKLMRTLYRRGSSPGLAAFLYGRIRGSTRLHRAGLALSLAGLTLRSRFAGSGTPVLVAHPLLVSILSGKRELYYQHGEVATPEQAVVPGALVVFVPIEEAAAPFLAGGYQKAQIVVTGLCIEPEIVPRANEAYARRRARIASGTALTGAFFSSGAEPRLHVRHLTAAAVSAVRAGGRAVIFAQAGGVLARRAAQAAARAGIPLAVQAGLPPPGERPRGATLSLYRSRAELDARVARYFDLFDYFAAPAHERTPWALGLGLPMCVLGPDIGPYAPLNHARLLAAGVACSIESTASAEAFGTTLAQLCKGGKLAEMAGCGFGTLPLDGFARIARHLADQLQAPPC